MSNIGSSANSSANNRRFGDKVPIPKNWLSFAGDCAPLRKYLASRSFGSGWAPLKFLDALFRGYGQVVFANNPISGVLIFISLTVADPLVSAAGLLTASVGLLGSIVILPQPPEILSQGVTVFNSLLIGLITAGTLPTHYGLNLETWHWFSMIIAATMSVYVESALGNILGSLCRFPLPYLTLPFNIVQQLLFLTAISIATLNARDTPPIATHHMTSQPPLLVPSSLISIDRLRQIPVDTTQPTLLSNLNALKETSPPGILIDGSTTDTDTFFGDVLEDHTIHSDTLNIQHIAVTPSEAADFEDNFPYGQIMSKSTQETVREYDTNANGRVDSKFTVTQSERIQTFTIGANDFEQKETSVTTLAPDHKQFALTESSEKASNSHLQPNSASPVQNNVELMQDTHSYTEGEDYETGNYQSIAFIVMDSSTSEITPLFSTSTNSDLNEDDVLLGEETVTVRLKRSISLEATEPNSLTPHQNASFGIMEPVVDWGGVFSGVVLSMSQVYGISHAPTAILMYLAVLIYSPIMAAFAVLGATLGTLTGVLLTDVDTYAVHGGVYDGTWGFNGLLSAMCLGGLFFVVNWPATMAAVLCSFLSTVIMNVLIPPFAQANLSPMSLPFNISTLLFLCVSSAGALVRPDVISFPEKHRQEYKHMLLRKTQEQSPSTSDINDKDEDMEKKALSEVKVV